MDQQMALTWGLCYMALVALCWGHEVTEEEETVPLKTLECYNDYTNRIICSWADTEDAQGLINMTLLYHQLDKIQSVSCELSEKLMWSECPSSHRCVPRRCVIPYTRFSNGDNDYYSFQPDRDLGIQLMVPLAQHGDKAQPQNLQCFFDGIQSLHCSWEVWTQTTGSVSFGLFYRPSPAAPEEKCSPVVKEPQASVYTRYRCSLPVPEPSAHSQYTVSVKHLEQGKFIMSYYHIQMEPPILNQTKNRDSYSLHWETQKIPKYIDHTFQVQYKKKSESWKDSKTENLGRVNSMDLPQLEPDTSYCARVRVKPISDYDGIWSEWSNEYTWTTDWVMPTLWIVLILVFLIFTLLLALHFGRVYGYRTYRKWKEKIPNPSKSLLFQDGGKGLWPPGSMAAFATKNPALQGPQSRLLAEQQGVSYEHLEDNNVSPLTIEDPNIIRDPPSRPDTTPAASSESTEQLPNVQVEGPIPSSRPRKQLPSFDFNGPYLGPPQSHSLPDLPGQLGSPQVGGSLKPALPGSLEYMCLPPGGQVQLVPLSQVMGQGQAMDVQCGSSLETTGSPSVEPKENPPVELSVEKQEARDNPMTLPISSGGPEGSMMASDYVTPGDPVLTLPTGPLSTSLGPSLGLPSAQSPSLCLKLPRVPSGSPALGPPGFEDYVELPPSVSQAATSPPGHPAPPVASSPTVIPGEPREEVGPASPHPEGLLVLQQVGDYCFLPGLGPGSLSPHSKPPSPSLCSETEDLDQDLSVKKFPYQPLPQAPAIQFFKSLKY
ncbi:interleukin-3 receptor class 2 subunit beta isoform 2 precursor [Mus musculus]|uniref:Colony stimulating factor 2 receptor, beta 2, low-affinity (granulocyte-macrophage) n=1 Tax=Mus musculus TaxID=10090 RepID=A0A2R8VHE8_MOUSE|nr:interleukin-3 receptor class 2 subunit beta isoform 2 precursor [Mus musculus]|eukprot:NP_001274318.1 interleukin-3 receptor class 2 subunit beta isoform 2 precursor [Mus musculus]